MVNEKNCKDCVNYMKPVNGIHCTAGFKKPDECSCFKRTGTVKQYVRLSNSLHSFINEKEITLGDLEVLLKRISGWVSKFDNTPEADEYLEDNPKFKEVVDKL